MCYTLIAVLFTPTVMQDHMSHEVSDSGFQHSIENTEMIFNGFHTNKIKYY